MIHRLIVAALAFAAWTSPAVAQSLSGTTASGGAEQVERDQVLSTAKTSFDKAVERVLQDHRENLQEQDVDASESEFDQANAASRFQRLFERDARDRLIDLEGDGVLMREEAATALDEIRTRHLGNLRETLAAHREGKNPPPMRTDDAGSVDHIWQLVRYTFAERNAWWHWLLLALFVAAGLAGAWGLSLVIGGAAGQAEERLESMSELLLALVGPIYLTAITIGIALGIEWIWLPVEAQDTVNIAVRILFVLAAFWLAWNVCRILARLISWAVKRTYRDPHNHLEHLFRKILQLLTLIAFAIYITEAIFQADITNLLVGVGIITLVISLAAQDSLKNLFGTFTIVLDRPFDTGDLVKYQGYFGRVEDIGFRSTRIREFDGHLVVVPNADIVNEACENISARPWIRRRFYIDITYDTSPEIVEKAISILEDVLKGRDDEPDDMPTHILFHSFGNHSLRLLVQYCIEPGDYWEALEAGTKLNLEIKRRFDEAGVIFAFPTQTLELKPARVDEQRVFAFDVRRNSQEQSPDD